MKTIVLILLLLCVSGCSTMKTGDSTQPAALTRATQLLEAGDKPGATAAFNAVTESSKEPGVADEALFQLALLSLHPANDKDGNAQALQLLKKLKKEYPNSRWAAQSAQLADMLAGIEELRRQNRSLKKSNQSLTNEVNELNRNIKQLKRLDQELEKARH
jgi:outer membrane protein assembly factor BamD (BamD/ComL family)